MKQSTTSSSRGRAGRTKKPSSQRSRTSSPNHSNGRSSGSPLEKFFLGQLRGIYFAEQIITEKLPGMQEAATTEDLKEAFEDHLAQTQRHLKRLDKVFQSIGQQPEGGKCDAMQGIAKEVETIIEDTEEGTLTRDAALIIAAQKVEHYEIATYGGLVQLAITMELHDAADLLDRTLIEEEDTDARLTEVAENYINLRAEHEETRQSQGGESEEEEGSREKEYEEVETQQ